MPGAYVAQTACDVISKKTVTSDELDDIVSRLSQSHTASSAGQVCKVRTAIGDDDDDYDGDDGVD